MKITIEGDAKEIAELLATTIRHNDKPVEIHHGVNLNATANDLNDFFCKLKFVNQPPNDWKCNETQSERVFVSTPPLTVFEPSIESGATVM